MDTIFALSTVRGRAGVAVIRVSGPEAQDAGRALAGSLPAVRRAGLRKLRHPETGEIIDEGLVLSFPAGESFTGDNIVEFQIHGSIAVQDALLGVLSRQPGLRLAEPGEFTRRALENGRLDLTQVEGLGDLLDAETEAQRRQAVRAMQGVLGQLAGAWRKALVRASALLEASIDFADEDLPEAIVAEALERIDDVRAGLQGQLDGAVAAERIRDGFEVAILGRPNVGKSTLLNALAGREAAITSEIAGTTRDVIEVRMDIRGLPVTLLDTAGLREAQDRIEAIGVERARARAEAADLRIFLLEGPEIPPDFSGLLQQDDLLLSAKADLGASGSRQAVSGLTGEGIDALLACLSDILGRRAQGASAAIRVRHRMAMEQAKDALDSARQHVVRGPEFAELAAQDLRHALRSLDLLVGKVDVEALLDEIFSSFCLGK